MKGRSVVGSLAGVMKGRTMSMDVKRGLRNSILLPTLTYGSENWTWNFLFFIYFFYLQKLERLKGITEKGDKKAR